MKILAQIFSPFSNALCVCLAYGCRNGAKFNILKFYSYSTFIHSYSTFVFVFSINICSKFNTYIYIQQFYLFTKLLSIQKLSIHSTTFYSFKIYCASLLRMEVTYFLQRMNRGQRRSASHRWNFEKIPTAFALSLSEERLRRSEHLRLCLITLRRCSIDFLQIFFTSFKPEKNAKKCCTPSEKLIVSLTLQWARGVLFFSCLWKTFISN